jgi:hypothetical protein
MTKSLPTEGQIAFIADLRAGWEEARREIADLRGEAYVSPAWVDPATRAEASAMIEGGKAARRTARSVLAGIRALALKQSGPERDRDEDPGQSRPAEAAQTDGLFIGTDGSTWKVQYARTGTGRLYAKRLDVETGTFEYTPGGITVLRRIGSRPMTEEEASGYGMLYGRCVVCGRTLTDEGSIAAGIGPICAEKF